MDRFSLKKELRKRMAAVKKSMEPGEHAELSAGIMKRLEELPEFQECGTVLIYNALPDEVQTAAFLDKWHPHKRIILPVVEGENLVLKEYVPGKTAPGAFSIQEPVGTRIVEPEEIDLAVIPGVAFDARGNRLGRGKGFYDRLIPRLRCKLIGLGYECQIVDKVPTEVFDRRLDGIVTEKNIYGF